MTSRRSFLRGMAVAPISGQMALRQVASKVLGSGIVGAGLDIAAPTAAANGPLKFTNFLTYALKREKDWRRQAKNTTAMDPDLLSMHLPLTTLLRIQERRNYARIKADEEFSFASVLKQDGHFSFWG